MILDDKELIIEFVIESREGLAGIETDLLDLEAGGEAIDSELVNRVFRAVHTIKGTSGFIDLPVIGELAHAMENVLSLMRNGELIPCEKIIDVLLKAADTLSSLIEDVENSNQVDVSKHVEVLTQFVNGTLEEADAPASSADALPSADSAGDGLRDEFQLSEEQLAEIDSQGQHAYVLTFDIGDGLKQHATCIKNLLESLQDIGTILQSYVDGEQFRDLSVNSPTEIPLHVMLETTLEPDVLARFFNLDVSTIRCITATQPMAKPTTEPVDDCGVEPSESMTPTSAVIATPTGTFTPQTGKAGHAISVDASVRVPVSVLDSLMNLAGELVLGRNQMLQSLKQRDMRNIELAGARMDQITSELQEAIMQTRMQPIGTVFNKFTRIVRDLSNTLNKNCNLIIEGSEVELDKTIVEAIGDPLTHLIRNSVDHGIEQPEVRIHNEKTSSGTIVLRAFHQEGKVHIIIKDDGAGIDVETLKKKAVEKGINTAEEVAAMTEREAVRLIFHPGFSMAEKLTDVSGRGVGMDVVRTNIEAIGGTVEVETRLGVGTTIEVKLPLTLAIVPSLIIHCGAERFAIPQVNISELVRVNADEIKNKIQRVKNAEVLRLRDQLLPLVRMSNVLESEFKARDLVTDELHVDNRTHSDDPTFDDQEIQRRADRSAEAVYVIVVESGQQRYGLVVDGLHDSEEIVVKPLGRHMAGCQCLAGATVLGDGRVALILDVAGIAKHTELRITHSDDSATTAERGSDDVIQVLIFKNDPHEQFAVPMTSVVRIERIRANQIDSVGGIELLQYRGASLPLLRLEDSIASQPGPEQDHVYVVVFNIGEREVGLIASYLIDIRDISMDIDTTALLESGVAGTTFIDDQATRVIDLFGMARTAHPEWFERREFTMADSEKALHILLAEDSDFFRRQVAQSLEFAGYEVTVVEDGLAAWKLLGESSHNFDLVLTDIEMPNMNGFELSERIKQDPTLTHLPIIALTSLSADEHVERGKLCGIDDYQVKLDRDKLFQSITNLILNTRSAGPIPASISSQTAGS